MKTARLGVLIGFASFALIALRASTHAAPAAASITQQPFGTLPDGRAVSLYTLTNAHRMTVQITNYGGIITSLRVPDRHGAFTDVVLGYDTLDAYVKGIFYYGAIVGRYANRIAEGKFTLDGKTYQLAINSKPNSLHGGKQGFDKKLWTATTSTVRNGVALSLRMVSPDGDEGYPGNLSVHVTYTLTDDNALRLDYSAVTDGATIINLTNHSYFNLAGAGNGDVLGCRLTINADQFTPLDETSIPTGELRSVRGTPFDFLQPTTIGAHINENDPQLKIAKGYDHNFVINGNAGTLRRAAQVEEPVSGRVLTVFTDQPGLQLFTFNTRSPMKGRSGESYVPRGAFCLEAQHFPDSPNHLQFPTTILRPGQVYRQTTVYKFAVAP